MGLLTTMILIFAITTFSVQDEFISSCCPSENAGEFFVKVINKSLKFNETTEIVLEFDIDLGNRTFKFVNFTTPCSTLNSRISSVAKYSDHRVVGKFTIFNFKEYQIDATVFVRPL